ncbi:MAG TPA: N-acetyltransferase [Thermohalobaculum sp.]|nr:N-acetyltransferase [Thermohalobaculum sp.]
MQIREFRPGDIGSLERLYRAAFPAEDLVPLLRDLSREPGIIALVAEADDGLAGHVAVSPCGIAGTRDRAALLGPLAVAPGHQRQGIGSALVRAAIDRAEAAGLGRVCVLGDPAYYGRLGFRPEPGIAPPYRPPEEWRTAWQSAGRGPALRGRLEPPAPWCKPELWSP